MDRFNTSGEKLECPQVKVVIIYDDRDAGLRAKEFADRLVETCGSGGARANSIWRSELLDFQPVVDEVTREAMDSDFIIVSFARGGRIHSAVRRWLDENLPRVSARGTALIALFDPAENDWRAMEGNRHCCRSLCSENGVAFFSHIVRSSRTSASSRSRRHATSVAR